MGGIRTDGAELLSCSAAMEESSRPPLWILQAGIVPYADAWHLQVELRKARKAGLIRDTLLLLQHPPTITLGRRGTRNNLLVSDDVLHRQGIDMYVTDRGGDITYHGPGQIIGYPILDLHGRRLSVARYLSQLEDVLLRTLADLGIEGSRRPGLIGIWIGSLKAASLGIRVSGGITSHGFGLNVSTDLQPFQYINPCGMPETRMTSISMARNETVPVESVQARICNHFQTVFACGPCTVDALEL